MTSQLLRKSLLAGAISIGICGGLPLAAQAAGSYDKQATPAANAPSAGASEKASAATVVLSPSDRKFIEQAAQGGVAEVKLGQLAAQKGESSEVKQFGQRMADDHAKANDKLQQVASGKGVNLPTDMDAASKREYEKLQKLSGARFDQEYMNAMVSDHKKDVKEFQKEEKAAKDSDVKTFAANTLPTLEEHLKLAQSGQAAVKGHSKSASAPQTTGAAGAMPERHASAGGKKSGM